MRKTTLSAPICACVWLMPAALYPMPDARCRVDAVQALKQQTLDAHIRGENNPIAPSIGKLQGIELKQHLTEIGLAIAGPYAAARLAPADCAGEPVGPQPALSLSEDAVFAMGTYLNDRAASIYAGTNEVQRKLIAQHLLRQGPSPSQPVLGQREPSETQVLMHASLSRWLAHAAPFERRAALLSNPAAIAPLWQGLAHELGLLGAALPEAVGGQSGGLADQMLILQALGPALLPPSPTPPAWCLPPACCEACEAGLVRGRAGRSTRCWRGCGLTPRASAAVTSDGSTVAGPASWPLTSPQSRPCWLTPASTCCRCCSKPATKLSWPPGPRWWR